MYYISEFSDNKRKNNVTKDTAILGAGALVSQRAIRSGLPRALGVRLESHSTSKDTARKILNSGGYLDPNYGGSGAAKILPSYEKNSTKYVHLTGYHPDSDIMKRDNPLINVAGRKMQRSMYRGITDVDWASKKTIGDKRNTLFLSLPFGATGAKGRTLYVGGSDKFFKDNFIPDEHDVALKSSKPVKVFGSRLAAVKNAIKREGLGSLMKANPKRVLAGLGLLGVATVSGVASAKAAKRLLSKGKSEPSSKENIKVKGFLRNGKLVKSFYRKNTQA
jgi:hypothetical protein